MINIAVIFDASLEDRKGKFNAVLGRIKALRTVCSQMSVDVYLIHEYDTLIPRILRNSLSSEHIKSTIVDDIQINILWRGVYLIDLISMRKFNGKAFISDYFGSKRDIKLFKRYDLISSHSFYANRLAMQINEKYGIPFYANWHGSDIHSVENKYERRETKKILKRAKCNFFVSNSLAETAKQFTSRYKFEILFNGIDQKKFFKYSESMRYMLKNNFGTSNKVVAFVGNIIDIKNALLLPDIFYAIKDKYTKPLTFWVIGDGNLRSKVEDKCKLLGLDVKFWGNQPTERMPDIMNCIDILVLPSKNEGLPMVLIESIACGASALASDVGGCKEVVGELNSFKLDSEFINNIANRASHLLFENSPVVFPEKFLWTATAQKEDELYKRDINNEK